MAATSSSSGCSVETTEVPPASCTRSMSASSTCPAITTTVARGCLLLAAAAWRSTSGPGVEAPITTASSDPSMLSSSRCAPAATQRSPVQSLIAAPSASRKRAAVSTTATSRTCRSDGGRTATTSIRSRGVARMAESADFLDEPASRPIPQVWGRRALTSRRKVCPVWRRRDHVKRWLLRTTFMSAVIVGGYVALGSGEASAEAASHRSILGDDVGPLGSVIGVVDQVADEVVAPPPASSTPVVEPVVQVVAPSPRWPPGRSSAARSPRSFSQAP